jgi:hypothetical protein
MTRFHFRLLVSMGAFALVLATAPAARAWHISGQVFCDVNGNQTIDGADAPRDGVGVLITSLTASPGTTFAATTGGGNGFYTRSLPDHDDDYRVELTGAGLPAGTATLVPASGAYGAPPTAAIHLQGSAFDANGVSFLVDGCVAAAPAPRSTTATRSTVRRSARSPASASPTVSARAWSISPRAIR